MILRTGVPASVLFKSQYKPGQIPVGTSILVCFSSDVSHDILSIKDIKTCTDEYVPSFWLRIVHSCGSGLRLTNTLSSPAWLSQRGPVCSKIRVYFPFSNLAVHFKAKLSTPVHQVGRQVGWGMKYIIQASLVLSGNHELTMLSLPPTMTGDAGLSSSAPTGRGGGAEGVASTIK